MDYNKILDELGYPPEYNREKAIEAMKMAVTIAEDFPPVRIPPAQPTPQDLRGMAVFLYGKYADESIPLSEFVDAMLQFASEVSAEKDREIEELKDVIKELRGDITAQELMDGF